jgi:hypothetical protein
MGIGARTNVDMELYTCNGICLSPSGPMKKRIPSRSIRRKAKAIGNPDRSNKIRPVMKKVKTAHHSISDVSSR